MQGIVEKLNFLRDLELSYPRVRVLTQRLYMFVCVQMCECINRLAEG